MSHRTGQCLCGAVRVSGEVSTSVEACQCSECRRWTGGGPLYSVRVKDLVIEGEEHIEAYHHSAHGERAFCRKCGTTLYWKMQVRPPAYITVGLLDDQSGLTFSDEYFADNRPDWLPPLPGAKQHSEAEMKAQLEAFLKKEPDHDQI